MKTIAEIKAEFAAAEMRNMESGEKPGESVTVKPFSEG